MTLKKKIAQYLEAKDAGKESYGRADELLTEIVAAMKPGETMKMGDGIEATLVDNFAKGNKAWKPCGVNRFDLKITGAK